MRRAAGDLRAHRARARPAERRRVLAVSLVAAVLALAGVANADLHPRAVRHASRASADIAPSVVTKRASSTAWYCAGPLPVGTAGEASSIAVTNLGARPVSGEVVVASTVSDRPVVTRVRVPAGEESVVGLARHGARGSGAATVLVDGGGIAVEEIVHGEHGLGAAPCADHPASVAYLAAGSTLGASNLSLAVFDPGATPAVVGVTFVTSSGTVEPPAFQGLTVGAGRLQVLDVGHYVPSKPIVATVVNATGGRVVAGTAVTAVVHRAVMASLAEGVSAASSSWLIPGGPTGTASSSTFSVLDPGPRPAKVQLQLVSPSGGSELSASVPAHGVVALAPASENAPGAMRWASVTSTGAAVVVARETVVTKAVESRGALLAARAERAAAARAAAERAGAAKRAAAARRAAAAATAAARAASTRKHAGPTTTTTTTTTTTLAPPTTTTVVPYLSVSALPELQPGVAVTSGVSSSSTSWVLPGGESDARTSEVVVVANTSRRTARVVIEQLHGAGSGPFGTSSFATMPPLSVVPGATLTVDMATVVGDEATLPLLVTASEPVVAGQLLYGRKSSGFALAAAIAAR